MCANHIKHLDLFSGIGGFALAAETVWPDIEHIFCDNDEFCRNVLKKHWPHSKIYDDVKTIKSSDIGRTTLVTGGFPCQPFSTAGKQRGKEDDRYLWPEMYRIIRETRPDWVIGENVIGLLGMAFDDVVSDLERGGYEVESFIIPACAVNAPHQRDRIWIIAHADGIIGTQRVLDRNGEEAEGRDSGEKKWGKDREFLEVASPFNLGLREWWTLPEPRMVGKGDGLPERLDRIKALGNAIVPQVAMEIMRAIKKTS